MDGNKAFVLSQPIATQVRAVRSKFRTPFDPEDLEEFFAFHDDPKEQQEIIETGRKALAGFVAGFEKVRGHDEAAKVFIRELKPQVAPLAKTMKVADPKLDLAPVEAALNGVVFAPTSRALAAVASPKVAAAGTSEAVTALFSALARTKEEKALFAKVAAKALGVSKKGGVTEVAFEGTVVSCGKAAKPAASVPESYAALAKIFGSVLWKHGGGASMGFLGIGTGGTLASSSWEAEALTEGDNAAFLAALKKARVKPSEVRCAFACGANWILFDPTRETKRGEPALGFVSHGDCEWVSLKKADAHDAPAVLLRLMAWSLAGEPAPYKEISA